MPFPFIAAATLGAAAINAFSAKSAKKGQEDANAAEMEFNSMEAQKQRDFEERMFGSRYQTTRKDLEAAGYNPLLAMGLNPSTPAGAAAVAHPKSTTAQSSEMVSHSAKNVLDSALGVAMVDKVKSEAATAKANARLHTQDADIATSQLGKKLAAFRYFMDKTGIGRGMQNVAGVLGAKQLLRGMVAGRGADAAINVARKRRGFY